MSSDEGRDALVAKVVSMAVLGLVPFALGVLPARLASYLGWDRSGDKGVAGGIKGVSLLLCFGGGVLLCTTFLHLQPEVREGVEALQEAGELPSIPGVHLSELLLCSGFFLVYLAEELVHAVLDSRHEDEEAAALHRTVSLRRCARHHHEASPAPILPRVTLGRTPPGADHQPPTTTSATPPPPAASAAAVVSSSSTSSSSSTQVLFSRSSSASYLDVKTVSGPLDAARLSAPPQGGHQHSHRHHVSYDTLRADTVAASLKGLLAVLALSFHAVFEGLAVGLESDASSVWVLCGAIAAHKLVIAFCVGVELVSARTRPALLLAYVATFAMVTPLGIGAGIAVTASQGQHDAAAAAVPAASVAVVVLQGMAAGTLLYVVFFEVLQRERSHAPTSGLLHLLAILVGFGLMLGLQMLSGHDHRHSHGSSVHHAITEGMGGIGGTEAPTHPPHGHEHHDHR
ncbi:probable zinc transporter 12 [Ischnura elegans]|uniref:probable zinc transporter 12 n=1 Tax=Ischnura elegans TaxID=197161 RepID=UPI001ED8A5A8|nr:probable zinc transporter 12 [Ischnura elegans]